MKESYFHLSLMFLGTEESTSRVACVALRRTNPCRLQLQATSRVDSSVPLTHHDPRDLRFICLVKKRKLRFSDSRIKSWIFLKKRTLNSRYPLRRSPSPWLALRDKHTHSHSSLGSEKYSVGSSVFLPSHARFHYEGDLCGIGKNRHH